jgi:polyhydroxybutyrate depolymerase
MDLALTGRLTSMEVPACTGCSETHPTVSDPDGRDIAASADAHGVKYSRIVPDRRRTPEQPMLAVAAGRHPLCSSSMRPHLPPVEKKVRPSIERPRDCGHRRPGRIALWRVVILVVTALPLAAACGDDEPAPGPTAPSTGTVTVELGDRPFRLFVPSSYTEVRPVALVIGLHGYTSDSAEMESYFRLAEQAEQRGFLYARPEGTLDRRQDQFWNATNACCNFYGSGVDDSTYLSQVIDEVKRSYAVDADQVFLIGHSNGGYMSHRMACDHADQITAIASLAGVVWADPARCEPSRPVNVLQIHGTADTLVSYGGASLGASPFPGAEATVAQWRELNGCADVTGTTGTAMDLDSAVAGPETAVTVYTEGCGGGTRVELWRMDGSGHVPTLTAAFTPTVLDFFFDSVPS